MPGAQRPSPLGLMVLVLLLEGPMHPYRLQKLIKIRGKDRVVNIRQRASIYQAIERLVRLDLVRVKSTDRSEKHPERTVYEITDTGRDAVLAWLRETLRATDSPFSDFVAGVSVMPLLSPDDARQQLDARAVALAAEITEVDGAIEASRGVPRLFLLEEEYRRTVLAAQLDWTRSLVEDLSTGRLGWSREWLDEVSAAFEGSEEEEDRDDDT